MGASTAILVRGLTKSYGSARALAGVDLEVQQGEVFGFLGPNGAGKTTTIRCLLGLIHADGGTMRVMGIDPRVDPVAVHSRVGYLPGELHLHENWNARRQLRYLSDLRGGKTDWSYVRQLAERLQLDLECPIKNLSKGNKQKVGITQALMHRPPLLLLDEPTGGLDPLMQREVLGLVQEARAAGSTVLFSSHIIGEVETVADRVGIIRAGRVVETADTASLVRRSIHQVRVRFLVPVRGDPLIDLPGVAVLSRETETDLTLQVEGEMDGLVKALAGFPVGSFESRRPTLEEVFLAYYERGNGQGVSYNADRVEVRS